MQISLCIRINFTTKSSSITMRTNLPHILNQLRQTIIPYENYFPKNREKRVYLLSFFPDIFSFVFSLVIFCF
ncbi:hypothetical protein JCM21531_2955 [Acetivibrio straminisolvens JCM 21531]|uniref:Uncharacterized protein n=1 Tax=Acetivibrio straminisolvens JCM 21531 TaxID=1294263 RepID=W4V7U9_9FIRM|nr:hypothetical protein JCM21531_2955 [Acetivibrio straminisolvens JCM 21531]